MKRLLTLIAFLITAFAVQSQTRIRYLDYNEVHIQMSGVSSKLYLKNSDAYRTGAAAINAGGGEIIFRNVIDSGYVLNDSTIRVLIGGVIYPWVIKGGKHNLNWGTTFTTTQVTFTNVDGGTVVLGAASGTQAGLMTTAMFNSLNAKIETVATQYSISGNGVGSPIQLAGDMVSPGNSKYYGTDGTGTRGFWDLPGIVGGDGQVIPTTWAAFQASSGLSVSKIYYVTDEGRAGSFKWTANVSDQSSDNDGTVIVNAGLQQFTRLYHDVVSVRWFGATNDGTSNSSPGTTGDDVGINKAIVAAREGETVAIDGGGFYRLSGSILVNNNRPVIVSASIVVDKNVGYGVIVEGFRQVFRSDGFIYGTNTGATDSTAYAAYTDVGVYLKNCDKCIVQLNNVRFFRVGARLAGESITTPKGTQHSYLSFSQMRDNYIQIELTTLGTTAGSPPSDRGNWCNGNVIYGEGGGQLGGGTTAGAGGTFGIMMRRQQGTGNPAIDSDQEDNFNGNSFTNVSPEGVLWGIWVEQALYNLFSGRIEGGAVGSNKKFYLREDGGVSGDEEAYGTTLLYHNVVEDWFYPGGFGNYTRVPYGMLGDPNVGIFNGTPLPKSGKGWFNLTAFESPSNVAVTDHDFLSFSNASNGIPGVSSANLNKRYLGRLKRYTDGVDVRIPVENKDTTVTTSYTVGADVDRIYVNSASATTVTLPAIAWRRRDVTVTNIGAGTVTLSGTLGGSTPTTLAQYGSVILSNRQALAWEALSKPGSGGGGGGGMSLTIADASGTTANAKGAQIVNTDQLQLLYATTTFPGIMSTVAQGFAGIKTFQDMVVFRATTTAPNTQSIKIPSGTLMTEQVAASVEASNDHIYWTNAAGERMQLDNPNSNAYTTGNSVTTSAASYEVADNIDLVICNKNTSGLVAINLPLATNNKGRIIRVVNIGTGSSGVSVSGSAYGNNTLTAVIGGGIKGLEYLSNGTEWIMTDKFDGGN
jgi:hypothetical protein